MTLKAISGHNHVLKYHHYEVINDEITLCMDIYAENLFAYKNKKQLDIAQNLDIVMQVATALQYIHNHGVVHKDVNPANIVFKRHSNGIVTFKLAYFEAPFLHVKDEANGRATELFQAPEVIMNNENTNVFKEPVDIYSLGAIFFWLLSGSAPFTMDEVKQGHANPKAVVKAKIDIEDVEFYGLLISMLQIDPSKRPKADEVLKQVVSLNRLLTESSIK